MKDVVNVNGGHREAKEEEGKMAWFRMAVLLHEIKISIILKTLNLDEGPLRAYTHMHTYICTKEAFELLVCPLIFLILFQLKF